MRALLLTVATLIFAAGFIAGGHLQSPVGAQGFTVVMDCGASSSPQVRTTLYFGLARPKGSVTELEWQISRAYPEVWHSNMRPVFGAMGEVERIRHDLTPHRNPSSIQMSNG